MIKIISMEKLTMIQEFLAYVNRLAESENYQICTSYNHIDRRYMLTCIMIEQKKKNLASFSIMYYKTVNKQVDSD